VRVRRLAYSGSWGSTEAALTAGRMVPPTTQVLEEAELEHMLNDDVIKREAIRAVEQVRELSCGKSCLAQMYRSASSERPRASSVPANTLSPPQDGIVFIDEIDKICTSSESRFGGSSDASSEGVQRDLLPIIEGTTVSTKHGNVQTDHILFIASGAFHSCKPSDMLAELQGRLPIRVTLKGLDKADLYRILTEPEYSMITQQVCWPLTRSDDFRLGGRLFVPVGARWTAGAVGGVSEPGQWPEVGLPA
jgi:hypothetical protein